MTYSMTLDTILPFRNSTFYYEQEDQSSQFQKLSSGMFKLKKFSIEDSNQVHACTNRSYTNEDYGIENNKICCYDNYDIPVSFLQAE